MDMQLAGIPFFPPFFAFTVLNFERTITYKWNPVTKFLP